VLARFADAGIDVDALAARLQDAGARSFSDSWAALMGVMQAKGTALQGQRASA
jgi:transaldolase